MAQILLPAERITFLLTRCLANLGPKTPVEPDDVRSLTVGDRDALLLHLRCLTFGNKIQAVLSCPHPSCSRKMDLELPIGDLLVPPSQNAKELYEAELRENGTNFKLKFRLPTGADQEVIARLACRDSDAASELLVQRCVIELTKNGRRMRNKAALPPILVESLSKRMVELDPQAEILLDLACPTCDHRFSAYFDIGDYFFRELLTHSQQLYREIHLLALHYHWSEGDILNMARSKRLRYLGLLSDALKGGENQ